MTAVALYREDAYLTRCQAVVTGLTEQGGVLLDRTVFYPTGGGQPGDAGTLRWDGGACAVATAVKHGEDIAHVPTEGETPPPVGTAVTAEIDAQTRDGHRRVHTALHLLSVVIPAPVTGGQISAGKGRLDFDLAEPPEDVEALQARLNALIAADHPVTETWITDEELAANPGLVKTMAVKPPMGAGRVRLVRIGDPGAPVDLQPCGGTHVRRTGEIGPVTFGKIEKKGKRNRRVTLVLG